MLTVYNCIVNEHDLRLVALAALICGYLFCRQPATTSGR